MLTALLVVIVAVSACSGSSTGGHEPSAALDLHLPDLTHATVDVTTPVPTEAPRAGSAAPTPQAAITRFVAGAAGGDTDTTFDLLAAPDRDAVRSRVGWKQAQGALPQILSFMPAGAPEPALDASTATWRGAARLAPRLDEVGGLVPARATITWTAVAEDGGWRVGYGRTEITPEQPPVSGATDTARAWVEAARACRAPDASLVYGAGVVGVTGYAGLLCNAAEVRLDAPTTLSDRPDPAPVLAAFGPEADRWARLVRASGPRSFALVLAPFDDRWIVIGVLAAGP